MTNEIRKTVAAYLREQAEARQRMRAELRARLQQERAQRTQDVAAQRQARQAELAAARQVWAALRSGGKMENAPPQAPPKPVQPVPQKPAPKPVQAEAAPAPPDPVQQETVQPQPAPPDPVQAEASGPTPAPQPPIPELVQAEASAPPAPQPLAPAPTDLQHLGMQAYAELSRFGRLLQKHTAAGWPADTATAADLAQHGDSLNQRITAYLTEVEASYRLMDADEQQKLSDYLDGLRYNVSTLTEQIGTARAATQPPVRTHLETIQNRLHELLGEMEAVHDTIVSAPWRTLMQQRAAGDAPASDADDLTRIRGIGSGIQQRLYQQGIRTYAQLASSDPDDLRASLGSMASLVKTEDWIAQARALSGMEN